MANLPDLPYKSPIADGSYLSSDYYQWLFGLQQRVQAGAYRIAAAVSLTNQSAAIAATPVPTPALSAGLYQVSYYARITATDGVSSSLTPTLGWTESAVALTLSGAAMTADTTTTVQSGVIMVQIDQATSIKYSTSYASNTPNKMKYRLSVLALQLQ